MARSIEPTFDYPGPPGLQVQGPLGWVRTNNAKSALSPSVCIEEISHESISPIGTWRRLTMRADMHVDMNAFNLFRMRKRSDSGDSQVIQIGSVFSLEQLLSFVAVQIKGNVFTHIDCEERGRFADQLALKLIRPPQTGPLGLPLRAKRTNNMNHVTFRNSDGRPAGIKFENVSVARLTASVVLGRLASTLAQRTASKLLKRRR
ncbi:hypothetical protein BKA80DRAFT_13113 [Phyllosticta citrichinensis]